MKRLAALLIGVVICMDLYSAPRGIRNNNPGNIINGDKWVGRTGTDGKYVKFSAPEYGIRAMGKIINTYHKKYKINTIRGIINRWAPPSSNNTSRYIAYVSQQTGIHPDRKLNIFNSSGKLQKERELRLIISAIIKMENGSQYKYSDQTYRKAFNMLR